MVALALSVFVRDDLVGETDVVLLFGVTDASATILLPSVNTDSRSVVLRLRSISSFWSSISNSGANAITPVSVGVFASTAEKKMSEKMQNKAVAFLVIKMLSFRLGIGFGSLVPVYVK